MASNKQTLMSCQHQPLASGLSLLLQAAPPSCSKLPFGQQGKHDAGARAARIRRKNECQVRLAQSVADAWLPRSSDS
jgi:hypothetical protein